MTKDIHIEKQLKDMLIGISTDTDFVDGVLGMASRDYERKKVIEYINKGKDISYESLLLFALDLRHQRHVK